MVNEIKFDRVDNMNNMSTSITNPKKEEQKTASMPTNDGITVNISTFNDMMVADNSHVDNSSVIEMKRLIESGHYKIDPDVLAGKLYDNVFKNFKTIG